MPSEHFNGDAKAAATLLTKQSKAWEDWIAQASERQLDHVMGYQNSKREQFKQPISEVMMHVFNYSTYHRGQLVNMLRQVGVEKYLLQILSIISGKRSDEVVYFTCCIIFKIKLASGQLCK